jgi:hypothetical protein
MKPHLIFALLSGLMTSASAAPADDPGARIDAAVDKAIAEWTVLMTCTALDPEGQDFIIKSWKIMTEKVSGQLKEKKVSTSETVAARMAALKPRFDDQAPASELITYCHAHPEWQRQMGTLEVARPDQEIGLILGAKP